MKVLPILFFPIILLFGCDGDGGINLNSPGRRGQTTCAAAGSFSNAQSLLKAGHSELDGDNDGVACEHLR